MLASSALSPFVFSLCRSTPGSAYNELAGGFILRGLILVLLLIGNFLRPLLVCCAPLAVPGRPRGASDAAGVTPLDLTRQAA